MPRLATWTPLESRRDFEHRLLRAELRRLRSDAGGEREVLVLDVPDWVNVIARDGDEVLLVRQWRFGIAEFTLEIPGGVVEPDESHREAAARELLEETGHTAQRWRYLGAVEPNPALQNNLCHTWLAEGIERLEEPRGDGDEELELVKRALSSVQRSIAAGEIRHSLVVAAFQLYSARSEEPRAEREHE